ncbi:MAG: DUF3592 domain-containing protein [Clostridia bacterium]|nr:DUF3592 domain-containing protein [Clostridia bacterium]
MPGIVIIVIALIVGFMTDAFARVKHQRVVKGKIVSLEYRGDTTTTNRNYAAVVEFEVDGEIYTAKSRHQSSSYYIGQSARVAYNREDPSQAIVKPKGVLYAVIFLMIAAGAAVAVNSFIK